MAAGRPPVLVVTGAAAAGKSTVGAGLAGRPGLLVLDGDVLAVGAAAVSGGRRDYAGFWRYLLAIAAEVHRNHLTPVFTCICLPEQVLGQAAGATVHFLALVSNADTVRNRITARAAGRATIDLDFHSRFDSRLRAHTVPAPHTIRQLDTSLMTVEATVASGQAWAADVLPGPKAHVR